MDPLTNVAKSGTGEQIVGDGVLPGISGGTSPGSPKKGVKTKLWLGVAFSALLLGGLFYGLDMKSFIASLKQLQPIYFIPIAVLMWAALAIRAIRWRFLIPNGRSLTYRDLFQATSLGLFANSVLPLRAGEFVRPWVLSRWSGVSFGSAFASVVTERVFDVLAILTFLAIGTSSLTDPPAIVMLGAKALGLVAGVITLLMVVSYFFAETVIEIGEAITAKLFPQRFAATLNTLGEEFVGGLKGISSLSYLLAVIGLSFLLWFDIGLVYQCTFWLFGESPSLGTGILVSVIIALAVAAPSGPGFVGTYQAGCVVGISTIYLYTKEFALAYSIVSHVFQTLFLCVIGVVILNRRGLMLSELLRQSEKS